MAEKVLMLALSPTMEQGTIVKWNKKVGDTVETGDVICEVETDKATMDYEAVQEGTLLKILVGEGEQTAVGQPIAVIGEEGEDVSGIEAEAPAEEPAKEPKPGTEAQQLEEGEPAPAELMTGKERKPEEKRLSPTEEQAERQAASAQAKPASGEAGEKAREETAQAAGGSHREASEFRAPVPPGQVKASPLARRIARERGIDLGRVEGSGPNGRVVRSDVESYRPAERPSAGATGPATGGAAAPAEDREIPVSGKRKVIAQRLAESMYTAPHYYLRTSAFMEEVLEARRRLNERAKEKISLNGFLMKLSAQALARHPMINSSWQGDRIIVRGSIDIGLAVALEDGLITPIVRDCGRKGIIRIDSEVRDLIGRARENRLKPEEYQGATFTISNLGMFGIEEFTAIINPPGSAILALGETRKEPVVGEDDELEIRQLMRMTLSCDHRVIDGAMGAQFLATLKGMIEHPMEALY